MRAETRLKKAQTEEGGLIRNKRKRRLASMADKQTKLAGRKGKMRLRCLCLHTQVCLLVSAQWWRAARNPGFSSHSAWETSGCRIQLCHSSFHIPDNKTKFRHRNKWKRNEEQKCVTGKPTCFWGQLHSAYIYEQHYETKDMHTASELKWRTESWSQMFTNGGQRELNTSGVLLHVHGREITQKHCEISRQP